MKIAIVTDTNSGISAQEAKELGIFLLPLPVLIDGKSYLESIDITIGDLYDAMKRDADISTSQSAPALILELWDELLANGYDAIVHIPMTSGLSGSCHSAAMLAQDYEGRVFVVDNHRVSVTQRLCVMEAKAMADAGESAQAIKAYLEETGSRARIYVTLDSLKHLQKGGRLSASGALVGTLLNIKPVAFIGMGNVETFAKARGMKAAQKRMIEAVQADIAELFADVPRTKLRIATAGTLATQEEIDTWVSTVKAAFPDLDVFYDPLPCSLSTHIGPNAMGVSVSVVEK